MTHHLAPDPGTDAIVAALRAPGTAAELADAERYLALFRAGRDAGVPAVVPRRPRLLRRIGGGTALAIVVAAGTGGVAAARQGDLPAPLQGVAERVLSPVGIVPVPPAHPAAPRSLPAPPGPPAPPVLTHVVPPPAAAPDTADTPGSTATPAPPDAPPVGGRTPAPQERGPEAVPAGPGKDGRGRSGTPAPRQGTSPHVPPPQPEHPEPPVPPAPVVVAAALVDLVAPPSVAAGATATLTATVVDAAGRPLPGVLVVLEVAGPDGWSAVAEATSDAGGRVSLTTGPLATSLDVRLRTGGAGEPGGAAEVVATTRVEVTEATSHP